jgi:glycopeptide antibiotics resistance protein
MAACIPLPAGAIPGVALCLSRRRLAALLDGVRPAANVAVLPLGFFLGLALSRLRGRFTGMALATLLAGAISFRLESVQTWLPSRVPSNLDLACNTLGGLLGALWAQAVGPRFYSSPPSNTS